MRANPALDNPPEGWYTQLELLLIGRREMTPVLTTVANRAATAEGLLGAWFAQLVATQAPCGPRVTDHDNEYTRNYPAELYAVTVSAIEEHERAADNNVGTYAHHADAIVAWQTVARLAKTGTLAEVAETVAAAAKQTRAVVSLVRSWRN